MAPVAHCPKLQELYLAQNKLRELAGLEGLAALRKLDVGGNRIRSLQPVARCVALEELWAGKNKVRLERSAAHI
jgi:protein phosphatase 1 regulatory subunit 7